MQKYISTAVFSILLLSVIIFTAINYHNTDVLESRINTIVKYNSKQSEIDSEKTFKEDYYILQQSHDTNLILVVFGLVVAVIGFFTYQNIVAKFDLKTEQMKNEVEKYRTEWKELNDDLGALYIHFFSDSAKLSVELAEANRAQTFNDNYIIYLLKASSKYTELISLINDKLRNSSEVTKDELNDTISSFKEEILLLLKKVNDRIDNHKKFRKTSISEVEDYIETIRNLKDKDVNKMLSDIRTKIDTIAT
ncbi:MAG: hypothetical protein ACN6OI_10095 [Flavobacterium sp.]|uniref:hypothetical protein n=1 Tax=Flavobacterium sp. TaxID=239 RepID=UPI003D11193D